MVVLSVPENKGKLAFFAGMIPPFRRQVVPATSFIWKLNKQDEGLHRQGFVGSG